MADRQTTTLIGAGTFVRGRITGTGDLEIAGRIEGEVTCSGEVTIDAGGLVGASVSARRIVVRGAVKGDLVAEDAIVLEAGAKVVGALRAPRIAIAPGGLVRGHVQTGAAGAARPRAASASVARSSSASVAKPAAKAAPPPMRAAAPAPAPGRSDKKASAAGNGRPAARGSVIAGSRVGPPPPVVPALKKGTKAVAHKKR